jgi:hypothetical protein
MKFKFNLISIDKKTTVNCAKDIEHLLVIMHWKKKTLTRHKFKRHLSIPLYLGISQRNSTLSDGVKVARCVKRRAKKGGYHMNCFVL